MDASDQQVQQCFIYEIGPFLANRYGGLKPIARQLGVTCKALDDFLRGQSQWHQVDFGHLVSLSGTEYELLEWDDYIDHTFHILGHYTLHPRDLPSLIKAVDCVTCGGDCSATYEVVCHNEFVVIDPDTHYLVVDRGGDIFLFLIDKPGLLDRAKAKRALPNFDGERNAYWELFEKIQNHFARLAQCPECREEYDKQFFDRTALAFAQMTLATESGDTSEGFLDWSEQPEWLESATGRIYQ